MAFPQLLSPLIPTGNESVGLGDDRIRELKQFIADIFGLPTDPTQITAQPFSIAANGVVTFSQGVTLFQVGSMANPSITFVGNANTGIYSSAANTVDITSGGVRAASFTTVAGGVNYFEFTPAIAGAGVELNAAGTDADIALAIDTKGNGVHLFRDWGGAIERGRITNGILLWGTTLFGGAGSGDMVLANGLSYRAIDSVTSQAVALIGMDVGNRVVISGNGSDVRWGVPLAALGGGAAPTLGTIGGAGPANAAQQGWLRIIESTGSTVFMPVWV
jgi:hypothetical protein